MSSGPVFSTVAGVVVPWLQGLFASESKQGCFMLTL
jgi:hypothetical protein